MREFGSEQPAIVLPDGYFDGLKKLGREVTYLRSGREALLYTSYNCKPNHPSTILLPAYCCFSMRDPFLKSGWKIVYYRLNEDLTVNEEYLKKLLWGENPSAILTMNFYGSTPTVDIIRLIKAYNKNITVIEDFSHCTFSLKQIFNEEVDFYVSSIRKSIGVCDGAIVLSKLPTDHRYIQGKDTDFSAKRYLAQSEKGRYTYSKDQETKHRLLESIRECECLLNQFSTINSISVRAMEMLRLINGEEIAFARQQNMRHLWELLNGYVRMLPKLDRCFEGAPFSLPILVNDQSVTQKRLAQNGIYAPVLWPICAEARWACKQSAFVADHMLAIPIDQRYSWDDMELIAATIFRCLNSE